mmetsp:Transcript_7372/g.20459  ORF Transcript_7372/g.20459 Transcript_7372/m.20459 type:complete len:349 (+) Transcript_7372:2420-3466(+)
MEAVFEVDDEGAVHLGEGPALVEDELFGLLDLYALLVHDLHGVELAGRALLAGVDQAESAPAQDAHNEEVLLDDLAVLEPEEVHELGMLLGPVEAVPVLGLDAGQDDGLGLVEEVVGKALDFGFGHPPFDRRVDGRRCGGGSVGSSGSGACSCCCCCCCCCIVGVGGIILGIGGRCRCGCGCRCRCLRRGGSGLVDGDGGVFQYLIEDWSGQTDATSRAGAVRAGLHLFFGDDLLLGQRPGQVIFVDLGLLRKLRSGGSGGSGSGIAALVSCSRRSGGGRLARWRLFGSSLSCSSSRRAALVGKRQQIILHDPPDGVAPRPAARLLEAQDLLDEVDLDVVPAGLLQVG